MRDDCIRSITEAAARMGKTVTSRELRDIEQRILRAQRDNARENRQQTLAQSPAERVRAAAERVVREIVDQRDRELRDVATQVIAHDRNQSFIDRMAARGVRRVNALQHLLVNFIGNHGGVRSLEQVREGVARIYKAQLEPIVKATSQYAGFWTNKAAVRDTVREGYGQDTGNATAKTVWKLWRDGIAEPLRQQFNERGGGVGELDYGYVPQDHSMMKIARDATLNWVDYVLPRLDRNRYVEPDGSLMADSKLRAILAEVRNTLATDGMWNKSPEERGSPIRERGKDSRFLHFKDADSYLDYQAKYGERSLIETLNAHVDSMARNIAALETFGPRAENEFRQLLNESVKGDASAGMDTGKLNVERNRTQTMFDMAAGKMAMMGNPRVAHAFQTMKSVLASARLGSASLSAFTDSANGVMVARAWNMPEIRSWAKWEAKSWASAEHRQFMRSQGVGVEAITHSISRYGEEVFGHGMANNVANTVFRVSGLNFIDNVRRTAAGAMLYSRIGDLLAQHETLARANPADVRQLVAAGTDDRTWAVWRAAERDPDYGITPDAIRNIPDAAIAHLGNPQRLRQDAMTHLVGVVAREADTVVPMPTDKARASTENLFRGLRGTVAGEITRSILQFKAFPIAMISNHWQRLQSMPTGAGKAVYAAELLATCSILGAISIQMKSLVAGNELQDMTDPKFTGRAVVQGGALGLYGDLLINAWASPYKERLTDQLGPLVGAAGEIYDIADKVWKSSDPNAKANVGGDVTRFIKGNTPFASLWYAKAALDHLVFQRLQDYYSPGYADRMQQRMQKYYGSGQWWKPSTADSITAPQVPDMSAALGSQSR